MSVPTFWLWVFYKSQRWPEAARGLLSAETSPASQEEGQTSWSGGGGGGGHHRRGGRGGGGWRRWWRGWRDWRHLHVKLCLHTGSVTSLYPGVCGRTWEEFREQFLLRVTPVGLNIRLALSRLAGERLPHAGRDLALHRQLVHPGGGPADGGAELLQPRSGGAPASRVPGRDEWSEAQHHRGDGARLLRRPLLCPQHAGGGQPLHPLRSPRHHALPRRPRVIRPGAGKRGRQEPHRIQNWNIFPLQAQMDQFFYYLFWLQSFFIVLPFGLVGRNFLEFWKLIIMLKIMLTAVEISDPVSMKYIFLRSQHCDVLEAGK